MPELTHDIIIHGAGPTGSALALALARHAHQPYRIALLGSFVDSAEASSHQPAHPDPRTLALNHGSRSFLESLQAWPNHSADITTVHVSQEHRLGITTIEHTELGVPRLGSVVAYGTLIGALHERLRRSGVDLIEHVKATPQLTGLRVTTELPNRTLSARLAVQSHGQQSTGLQRTYDQEAVLATVTATQPRAGWAYERFTRQGPLALLPHPAAPDTYAVVWCCPPEQAARLRNMPRPAFDEALNHRFGSRLGYLRSIGMRHGFPLGLHAGPILLNPLTLAVGNAAQTLHPVAGQGLNLGLRDVARLAMTLTPWLAHPQRPVSHYLHQYLNSRSTDRWLTATVTDMLPRIFTTANPLVEHACGLALLGLDVMGPVRRLLARHLLQGYRI